MPFTQSTFAPISSHGNSDMPNIWTYRTTDSFATLSAEDYFIDKYPILNNGDVLMVNASDKEAIGFFVLSGGKFTVDEYEPGGNIKVAANEIIINEFADFPEPMLPDIQYRIGGNVIMPDTLPASWGSLPQNIEFYGAVTSSRITWNGSGDLFTGSDLGFFKILNVRIDAPNGAVYNISDSSGITVVNLISASIDSCQSIGTLNVFGVLFNTSSIGSAQDGVVVGDKASIVNLSEIAVFSSGPSYTHLSITSAELNTLEVINNTITGVSGGVFLELSSGGVNISSGQVGDIQSCELIGGVAPLSGSTDDDPAFEFTRVTGVTDSKVIGHSYIVLGDEAVTDIVTDTDVQISGVFTQGAESSQATSSASGIITTLNRLEKRGIVSIDLDVSKSGGSLQNYIFKIFKIPLSTGVPVEVDGVFASVFLSSGDSTPVSLSGPTRFIDGDQYYATSRGVSTNDDITANTQGFKVSE